MSFSKINLSVLDSEIKHKMFNIKNEPEFKCIFSQPVRRRIFLFKMFIKDNVVNENQSQ